MEPITFEYKLSQREFERASLHILRMALARGPRLVIYAIVLLTLVALLIVRHQGAYDLTTWFLLIWTLGASLFIWWRMKVSIRNNWRNNFRTQESIRYELTEEKIVQSGETFRLETSWDRIQRVEVWDGFYLLYLAKNRANAFHRSVLPGDMEQRLQQLLESCETQLAVARQPDRSSSSTAQDPTDGTRQFQRTRHEVHVFAHMGKHDTGS